MVATYKQIIIQIVLTYIHTQTITMGILYVMKLMDEYLSMKRISSCTHIQRMYVNIIGNIATSLLIYRITCHMKHLHFSGKFSEPCL